MTLSRLRALLPALLLALVLPALALLACTAHAAPVSLRETDAPLLAPNVNLNERVFGVQVAAHPSVRLQVTLYMPVSGGPFPLAVMLHGASSDPLNAPRLSDNFSAYYFLSRGYAVALPMMRGYAGSQGQLAPHGCDVVAAGLDVAHDVAAVIAALKPVPGIDASRIVVAGKSYGGWGTLALGTLKLPEVKGLVSFAGGMKESDCASPDAALVAGAATLGAHTRTPSIWFFGDNDKIFATATWQGMFQQYRGAGAPAELVDFGAFMDDAHTFTASGAALPRWVPRLDAFLARQGLPSEDTLSIYLPAPPPAGSGYAELNDLTAVPYLSEAQRALYRSFLAAPVPRAIAIGLSGAALASGGFDPAAAALRECGKQSPYCQLYAVDNAVVWPRQAGAPVRSAYAKLADTAALPYLDQRGRAAYARFLQSHRPRAFAIAPDGNWAAASGLDPITDALVQCSQGHADCQLYAVDGEVVWPDKALRTAGAAAPAPAH